MSKKDTLHVLFRRVQPESVIGSWISSHKNGANLQPMSMFPEKADDSFEIKFINTLQDEFPCYTVDEAKYAFHYAKQYTLEGIGKSEDLGVFGLIAKSVEDIFTTDVMNECLCKYKRLIDFRELSHPIDPTVFMAAHLARYDLEHAFKRAVFSWNPVVRTDNLRLHTILNKGMAENHFHIGGSSNAFLFSWICLMNHFDPSRRKEFESQNFDNDPLDTRYRGLSASQESNYLLTFKAVCIRVFLYLRLKGQWVNPIDESKQSETAPDENAIEQQNIDWLMKMLSLTENECDLYMEDVNNTLHALRRLCASVPGSDFIPDYALFYEPIHSFDKGDGREAELMAVRGYERVLYRPLAGEQRFLYDLFRAIYSKDKRILPYLDIAYAYLLIYCRIRGELLQVNNRIGFGNFLKYQDRKDVFTCNYPQYDDMRNGIAQRIVLENSQILSFEGRMGPKKTSDELISKVKYVLKLATNPIDGVLPTQEVESVLKSEPGFKEERLRSKLQYVIHFPKEAQWIKNDEGEELTHPRDHIIREKTILQANAIIEARRIAPEVMSFVTGVDACSSEIDCRPEVFACGIRKVCQHRKETNILEKGPPILRITYHAGEDFLDPLDGLRAINEATEYLCMSTGDRLGHALALGIDCEEWYAQKNQRVLMHAQELLDNLVWLYGKMHQFDIVNPSAEDKINKWFNKLYTMIYLNNSCSENRLLNNVDVEKYLNSLSLRGNDPYLYVKDPETQRGEFQKLWYDAEQWRYNTKRGIDYDPISNVLYHHYHFNFGAKLTSDRIVEFIVPKHIIQATCEIQEKMRYAVARKNIGIECNPSSNYLIGTFKDYLKHPLFRFNDKYLYPASDRRFSQSNPHISASINTDDLGIFDTSLENEFALMACALERYNEICNSEEEIPADNIYSWLDGIRENGCCQSFKSYTDRNAQ